MSLSRHGESNKFQQGKQSKTLVREELSLLFSSDPALGASNISADGSSFQITLQDGIKVPRDAHNVQVSLVEAEIWNVVPNILAGINDKFYISCPRASDDAITPFVATIPTGLYDLSALNDAIKRELENAGAKTIPNVCVDLLPDNATQKVEIRVNYANTIVDFTPTDTFRDILGFNSGTLVNGATAPFIHLAPNIAAFNNVNSFLIHTDLVSRGIRINNSYNQVVASVPINAAPGSQIIYSPFNPARVAADELAGQIKGTIRVQLTDQANRAVNTNNEFFTCRMIVSYLHAVWI